ncbi:unnamed protein product [Periconia digitata]|uniref:Uncharacterized protein n=1 Tax=Periconia digitata TaxID=1303443 RepID=A0A9W4U597_9PLEO|nr:unnamed protein product [Periconia digitata]
MYQSTMLVSLALAATVASQSQVEQRVLFIPPPIPTTLTMTEIGADSTATTYTQNCPGGMGPSTSLTCVPFRLVQGSTTLEIEASETSSGISINLACNYPDGLNNQGSNGSCVAKGEAAETTVATTVAGPLQSEDINAFQTVPVVKAGAQGGNSSAAGRTVNVCFMASIVGAVGIFAASVLL